VALSVPKRLRECCSWPSRGLPRRRVCAFPRFPAAPRFRNAPSQNGPARLPRPPSLCPARPPPSPRPPTPPTMAAARLPVRPPQRASHRCKVVYPPLLTEWGRVCGGAWGWWWSRGPVLVVPATRCAPSWSRNRRAYETAGGAVPLPPGGFFKGGDGPRYGTPPGPVAA
jgi:hypothetical protein